MSAEIKKIDQPKRDRPALVVYHANCIDGAASAYLLAKSMKVLSPGMPRVLSKIYSLVAKAMKVSSPNPAEHLTFIPYEHANFVNDQQKIKEALKDNIDIYFLDVAPPAKFMNELIEISNNGDKKIRSISVFDHHNTTAKTLLPYKEVLAKMTSPKINLKIESTGLSAVKLVWNELTGNHNYPDYLKLVNKMDRSNLKTREEFAAAAYIDAHDISSPQQALKTLAKIAKISFNTMAERGRPIAAHQKILIDNLFNRVRLAEIEILPDMVVKAPIVNADVKNFGRQISGRLIELGEKHNSKVALAWYQQQNGAVTMSIRTTGEPDAGAIANHLRKTMKNVTGGGHKDSAAVHFASLCDFANQVDIKTEDPTTKKRPVIKPCV